MQQYLLGYVTLQGLQPLQNSLQIVKLKLVRPVIIPLLIRRYWLRFLAVVIHRAYFLLLQRIRLECFKPPLKHLQCHNLAPRLFHAHPALSLCQTALNALIETPA